MVDCARCKDITNLSCICCLDRYQPCLLGWPTLLHNHIKLMIANVGHVMYAYFAMICVVGSGQVEVVELYY